jgi:hypothetical protein
MFLFITVLSLPFILVLSYSLDQQLKTSFTTIYFNIPKWLRAPFKLFSIALHLLIVYVLPISVGLLISYLWFGSTDLSDNSALPLMAFWITVCVIATEELEGYHSLPT